MEEKKVCKVCGAVLPAHNNNCPEELKEMMGRFSGRGFELFDVDEDVKREMEATQAARVARTRQEQIEETAREVKLPALPRHLRTIEQVLLADVVKRAYKFATSGGRYTLKALEAGGASKSHMENLRKFVKSSFESRLLKLKITVDERDLIVYHLIKDTAADFVKEGFNPDDTDYMVGLMVSQIKALEMLPKGVDDEGRFKVNVVRQLRQQAPT